MNDWELNKGYFHIYMQLNLLGGGEVNSLDILYHDAAE